MKTSFFIMISFLVFLSGKPGYGQIYIDLSEKLQATESIDLPREPILLLKNVLPDRSINKYKIEMELSESEIPAIHLPSGTSGSKGGCGPQAECAPFWNAFRELKNASEESLLPGLISSLEEAIKSAKKQNCDCSSTGDSLIKSTSLSMKLNFTLRYNQTITIKIIRVTGVDTVTWIHTYKTPERTPWHILYGFTFVPNWMNPEKTYFTKADTSGKSFTITGMNNQKKEFWKNISPTIMIQWAPMTKYNIRNDWKAVFSNHFYQLGFVSGLSLNFASETGIVNVMAGPSLLIADNVSLSGGLVFTQKNVLMGKYKDGDVVKENLEFDQLHDKKYMLEWFFSLAIRFDTNPFAKKETTK